MACAGMFVKFHHFIKLACLFIANIIGLVLATFNDKYESNMFAQFQESIHGIISQFIERVKILK